MDSRFKEDHLLSLAVGFVVFLRIKGVEGWLRGLDGLEFVFGDFGVRFFSVRHA